MDKLQKTSQTSMQTTKKLSYESKEFRDRLLREGHLLNLYSRIFLPIMVGFFSYYLRLFGVENEFPRILISIFVAIAYAIASWNESYLAMALGYNPEMKKERPFLYWGTVLLLLLYFFIPVHHALAIADEAGKNGWFLFPVILGLFVIPISSKLTQGILAKKIEDTSDTETKTVTETSTEDKEVKQEVQEDGLIFIKHGVSEGRKLKNMLETEYKKNYGELIPLMEEQIQELGSIHVPFLLDRIHPDCKPDRKTLEKICSKYVEDIRHVETKTIVEDKEGNPKILEQSAEKGKTIQSKSKVNGSHFTETKVETPTPSE